jgi:hypothetical protein
MDALQKNMASIRGEALAANMLATAAIQAVLALVSNREQFLTGMATFIDSTLNISGPSTGDANDEFNTQVRETARFQAMQTLDAIRHHVRQSPPKE